MSFKRLLLPVLLTVLVVFSLFPAGVYAEENPAEEDAVFLEQVLAALQDPDLGTTLSALQEGEVIKQGSVSGAARGLQKTLAAFGCDISVDGNAGQATFSALHKLQESFGLAPSETVDADAYAELLPLLLLSKDSGEEYEELLRTRLEAEEEGRYEYLKGCAYYNAGHYYRALEAFEDSRYKDFEERASACRQPWPDDGELWHNSKIRSSEMVLCFVVNSADESRGRCFEVYTEDNTLASVLFQTGSGTVETELPGGNYRIRDASGTEWYGLKDSFGRYGFYEYMTFYEFEGDEYLTALDAGYEWDISINVSEADQDAADVGSVDSNWDEWTGK